MKRDLAEIRRRSRPAASSSLAMTAQALGQALDDPETSATSRAACAKELRETMRSLRQLVDAEPGKVEDLDSLRARRAARKAAL